jgi:hypothetical protein
MIFKICYWSKSGFVFVGSFFDLFVGGLFNALGYFAALFDLDLDISELEVP